MKIYARLYLLLGAGALLLPAVAGCPKQETEAREGKRGEAMDAMEGRGVMEAMGPVVPEAMAGAPQDGREALDATAAEPPGTVASGIRSLSFTRRYPGVGTVRTDRTTMNVGLDIAHAGKQGPVRQVRLENADTGESRAEVLAVAGTLVTKLKVTVVEKTRLQRMNGKERVKKSPLAGRTYLLELKDGKPVALDGAGQPLPEEDARLVLREHRSFGKPQALLAALPAGPVPVGTRVPALAEALRQEVAAEMDRSDKGGTVSVEDVVVALKEVRTAGDQTLGVFGVSLVIRIQQGSSGSQILFLAGTLTFRAQDGWLVHRALAGPVTVMGKPNSGKMSMATSVTYAGP